MATITSNAGSAHPDVNTYSVRVDDVTASSSTTYSWDTWTAPSSMVVATSVTLLGSFTYNGVGEPSGSVAQILLDTDADGFNDFTIAFGSLTGGLLADLTGGNLDDFLGAAFSENDTITLGGEPNSVLTSILAMGGTGAESNDTVTVTGFGIISGDAEVGEQGETGGNDNITVNSTDSFGVSTIVGDFIRTEDDVLGGNDTIADASAASAFPGRYIAIGDFDDILTANQNDTVTGGDDILSGGARPAIIVGDFDFISAANVTADGGDDAIIGGSRDDALYGDWRIISSATNGATVIGGKDFIEGGAGDDTIYGDGPVTTPAAVTYLDGNDTLFGEEGDDLIFGGIGDDLLDGGDDNDTLNGGEGVDEYDGGDGIDLVDYSDSLFAVQVVLANPGNSTDATIGGIVEELTNIEGIIGTNLGDSLIGNDIDNIFAGGGGNDTIDGQDGLNTVDFSEATLAVTVDLALKSIAQTISAEQGTDTYININGITGSDFNDTLFGSNGQDSIVGGSGDDILLTGSSAGNVTSPGGDFFDGGLGSDTLGYGLSGFGQSGVSPGAVFTGGDDNDPSSTDVFSFEGLTIGLEIELNGLSGDDSVTEISSGNAIATFREFEEVRAGNGNDLFRLDDDEVDTISLGGGNDTLFIDGSVFGDLIIDGGSGNDSIDGGRGDDSILGGGGSDTLFGDRGQDTLQVSGFTGSQLAGGLDEDSLLGASGNDTIISGDDSDVDTVTGGSGNDRIVVTTLAASNLVDDISGDGGTDTAVFDHFSPEYIRSTSGGNVVVTTASGAAVTMTDIEQYEVAGIAFSEAEFLAATFTFTDGNNATVVGTAQDDIIFGNDEVSPSLSTSRTNLLQGEAGNDYIGGLGRRDTLEGGAGNDTLVAGEDTALIEGGADGDLIIGNDDLGALSTASYATSDARVEINLIAGTATGGHATGDTLIAIEHLDGSGFNDLLVGDNERSIIAGRDGNDNINGRGGNDNLDGDEGDDLVSGGNGADFIRGGEGADRLFGNGDDDRIIAGDSFNEEDDDTVFGGSGNDTVDAYAGDDEVSGQSGADFLNGDSGNDTLRGGSGNDTLNGDSGDDALFGNGNNDVLVGSIGNDVLQGAAGFDSLLGGGDNDTLTGGAGADTLDGGTGDDVMNGGANGDTFVFGVGYENDRINAFEQIGADKLQLDQALWSATPGLTEQQVINTFGSMNPANNILTLDFGGGDILEVQNSSGINIATMGSDVIFI